MTASQNGTEKTILGRTLRVSEKVLRLAGTAERTGSPPSARRVELTVMFTDIVGSTSFFERYGDDAGLEMVERHNRLLMPIVEQNGGRIVKTIGDAIMAVFDDAASAAQAAVQMQKALEAHNRGADERNRIRIRIGLNAGPVMEHAGDVYGDVVNAAARVESLADAECILVSRQVKDRLDDAGGFRCEPYDVVYVKGKSSPLEVFEVVWRPGTNPRGPRPLLYAGQVIGDRFEILAMLGEGGMGQVFRAKDRSLDEEVALKFIHPKLATDPEVVEQFKTEVKLARSITHPNVCRIHEFLQMDGRVFLSMELVDGEPLSEIIEKKAPLRPEQALEIMAGICAGLEAAHSRRVVHRDLKPGNILVERNTGRVVITDFGVARIAEKGASREAEVTGTPEYMAPEQASGLPAGPAADIYSSGIILYQLLCGRVPFSGPDPVEVAKQQVNGKPPPPTTFNPEIPAELERVVMSCLEKKPEARPPGAAELARRLGIGQRKPTSRPATIAWIAIAAGVVLAAALFAVHLSVKQKKHPGGQLATTALVASRALEYAPRWSPSGDRFAFLRQSGIWLAEGSPPSIKPLARVRPALGRAWLAWSPDDNSLYFPSGEHGGRSVARLDVSTAQTYQFADTECVGADASPESGELACSKPLPEGGHEIVLMDATGKLQRKLLEASGGISYLSPRWSPDASAIALTVKWPGFSSATDIAVFDIEESRLRMLTTDGRTSRAHNTDPAWGPAGEWIVYSSRRSGMHSLWAVSSKGGKSYPLTSGITRAMRFPDVSATGRLLFETVEHRLDIAVANASTAAPEELTTDPWPDRFPACNSSGDMVAFRSSRNTDDPRAVVLAVHEFTTGDQLVFPLPRGSRDLEWCGDSRVLVAQTAGTERRLLLFDLTTEKTEVLVDGFDRLWSPSADRDCRRVVFCGKRTKGDKRTVFLLDMKSRNVVILSPEDRHALYPAISPGGGWVAWREADRLDSLARAELVVMKLKGKRRTGLRPHRFGLSQRRLRFSEDGRFVYFAEPLEGGARILKVHRGGGRAVEVTLLPGIHTADFDLCPGEERIVYPVVTDQADIY
ncbi:MAG: hypothetical protein D6806_03750, partial [Deltaproteobacteria bacterium]